MRRAPSRAPWHNRVLSTTIKRGCLMGRQGNCTTFCMRACDPVHTTARQHYGFMQIYLAASAVLSFFAMQIDWGSRTIEYGVWLVFGPVGSIGFSGVVLPMVTNVVLPQDRS